ncbi:MAG: energy-coupling factor transporter transmembrane protein EcfT [Candidatus Latescibacterota bacterium]|nr:MAG: energy-coupling factor transporter transmembrane protein EcfT [Candidatus Latescibacterota bacterium]
MMAHRQFDSYQRRQPNKRPFIPEDPGLLMLAIGLIVVFSMTTHEPASLLLVLFYVLILHRAAGHSIQTIVRHAKAIAPFVLLIIVVNALLIKGEPIAALVPFVYRDGLVTGVYYGIRLIVMFLAIALFLSVTTPETIARGFAAAVKPFSPDAARRVALHSFVSLGYLPLFSREVRRVRIAQQFRGGGMDGGLIKKLHGARLLLVPLFLSAIQRSAQLATVIELRDIRSTIVPLLAVEPVPRRDYLFVLVTLVVLIAGWWIA